MKTMLLDAWRQLRARPAATLVAQGGLMLALAATLLLASLALRLSQLDPSIPEPEHIVILDFKGNLPGMSNPWFTASPVVFGDWLKQRGVPLKQISRTAGESLRLRVQGQLQPASLFLADADFPDLMGLRATQGDLRATLAQRDALAVTESMARLLWRESKPASWLGRTLESRGKLYRVTAVLPDFDPRHPANGHAFMAGFESQANQLPADEWQAVFMINGRVFARLPAGVNVDQVGSWMREAFVASSGYQELPPDWRTNREAAYFRGLPLTRLAFEGEANELRWQQLGALGLACALLLLLALLNALHLQAAQLLRRQRETALRQSLGAAPNDLLRLWLAEAALPLLLSAGLALLISWWSLPALGSWLDQPLPGFPPPVVLLGLALLLPLLLGLQVAGPAWLALRRPAARALQGRTASEGPQGRRLRQGLLALQLGGALALLAGAGVSAAQLHHLLSSDRGYETQGRLVMWVAAEPGDEKLAAPLLTQLLKHEAVRSFGFSDNAPSNSPQWITYPLKAAGSPLARVRANRVSPGYFATYGMQMLAGEARSSSGEQALVLDESAAQRLGFATPQAALGQLLHGGGEFLQEGKEPGRVVGVVRAVKSVAAREVQLPQVFIVTDTPQTVLTLHGPDEAALRRALDTAWQAIGAPLQVQISTAEALRDQVFRQEWQLSLTLIVLSLLAVAVAAVGTYALVADTLRRRRAEIVLRRLHGAGGGAIVRVIALEFSPPLLLATLIALPIALWTSSHYLDGFTDRVANWPGLGLPALAAFLTLLVVTLLAAVRHTQQALALRPIEALS